MFSIGTQGAERGKEFFSNPHSSIVLLKFVFSRIMIVISTLGKLKEDSLNLKQLKLHSEFKIARATELRHILKTRPQTKKLAQAFHPKLGIRSSRSSSVLYHF